MVANTLRSALQDPRFGPLTAAELPRVVITLSILSHDRPLPFRDEAELAARLRPGTDGLLLRPRHSGALFLPKVWNALPEPRAFVAQLKRKTGLPADHDVAGLEAFVFTAETFATTQAAAR